MKNSPLQHAASLGLGTAVSAAHLLGLPAPVRIAPPKPAPAPKRNPKRPAQKAQRAARKIARQSR